MIDDPYASIRPRRGRAVPTTPVVEDDPYASIRPRRDSLATYAANTTVPERPSLLSRTLTAGTALGKQIVTHPWDTAMNVVKGVQQSKSDLQNIIAFPTTSYERTLKDTGGDERQAKIRLASAAMLPLSAAGRALGIGAKALAGIDFAASAGFGAAQTPDDPGVGALLGLATNAVPYAPSAIRKLTGYEPVGPQLGPRAPVRRAVGDAGKPVQISNVMPLPVIDRVGTPPTMRTQFDMPRETPLPPTTERFPDGVSTGAVDIPADVPTLEQLRAGLPTRRAVEGAAGRRVSVNDVMPLAVVDRLANPPALRTQFDAPNLSPAAAAEKLFPNGFSTAADDVTADVPTLEQLRAGLPTRRPVESAGGRRVGVADVFPLSEIDRLANPPAVLTKGDFDAVTVQPWGPNLPPTRRALRGGYQTPEPARPMMAVPQGDLPAKLFPADAADDAAAKAAMSDGPITGESLNGALDEAVKTWRAAKLRDPEVQRRFAVVQQFQAALDATNGNVQVALDAVDSNKDRGMIRLLMGQAPKPPRATLKAGEAPIVPGNPEGTTKLGGGKSVDYRGYSDEQLAAELRRNHQRVVEGQEMLARGQWVRDLDDGVGGVVSGQTREAGRGKAQINQATKLLDAAERELRVRLQRQGLSGDALEDALVTARFGDEAPTPAAKAMPDSDDYAETGNTDFNFGANVVEEPPLPPPTVAPVAPVASAVPSAAPAAPLGTPAPVAGAVAAPLVAPPIAAPVAPVASVVDAPFVDARPVMAPSKDGAINWRTWFNQNQPGAQSAEKIMQDFVDANQPAVKAARGYESMAGTMARANVAANEFFKSLVDDPKNALDYAGIRKFVERHGEAGVPALKQAIARTASVMSEAAKVIADPTTSADDLVLAHRVVDSAFQTQDQLLGGVINEQARIGRSLNALKIQAKLSVDPDVWMIHAKRALGDAPMTDEVMARVRQLARDAGDACGGG